ncbi:hypothetical protein CCUS01_06856 [Colletotrichum cuscutae]|uniref:Uncharacterized protein n=1 Tax=Colletotrichum cuscutae TaxID=1209917 RepID=A0AAI9V1V9_9PEZI|nr:hypothetical protein CCUS01_06856 [Colletotrichum cuscutae]
MDVTESSEPTPSFSHLLGLLLEAITAYLLVRAPFLPELSCPSTHHRRRPLSPNYIRMIINLLLTSLSLVLASSSSCVCVFATTSLATFSSSSASAFSRSNQLSTLKVLSLIRRKRSFVSRD